MNEESQRSLAKGDAGGVAELIAHQRGRIRRLKQRRRSTTQAEHLLAILMDLHAQLTVKRRHNVYWLRLPKTPSPSRESE